MYFFADYFTVFKNKVYIFDRYQDFILPEPGAGFVNQFKAKRFGTVNQYLFASGIQKFFNIFQTFYVSSGACLDFNQTV